MVRLKHEANTHTGVHNRYRTQNSCVLQSGDIALYASKTGHYVDDYKFYLLDRHGNPTGQTIDRMCDNDPPYITLLPVTIKNQLCVACGYCGKILLINQETKQVTVAYTGLDVYRMCQGEVNTLYTLDLEGVISVLDMSGTNFTLIDILPKVDMDVENMCYTSELIVLSSLLNKRVCAVRSSDGQIIWDKSTQQIDGKVCDPQGLVYLHQVDLVLVGDMYNRRIIVVEAASGDVVQTIELEDVVGSIQELHVHDDQLVIWYSYGYRACFSFYTVSCIPFCSIILCLRKMASDIFLFTLQFLLKIINDFCNHTFL